MPGLLDDLTVVVAGDARALRFAARCLADLGARCSAAGATAPGDTLDTLWLGRLPALAPGPATVDVLLTQAGVRTPEGVAARAVVTYAPVDASAPRAGDELDERGLAAAGGVAVAVGDPDRAPLPLPDGALDALAGTHVAAAALAALRDGTGRTAVAGADVVAWAVATNVHIYLPYGAPWYRAGRRASGSGSCYPYSLFEARDGLYCLIGRTDRDWRNLVRAMGDPDWAQDPRFADPRRFGREEPEAADALVGPWLARHDRDELTAKLLAVDFACAPVLTPEEVLALPSLAGRWRIATDGATEVRVPGPVFDALPVAGPAVDGGEPPFVLDLSWVWSGPAVSVALADLGATVVKVESGGRPDNTRLRGRPLHGAADGAPDREVAPYFHALNRGKRSVELDLKTDAGRRELRRLADRADVIVENLSAGVTDRWGIAPDVVHETNPGCVYLSMRGYRQHETTRGLRAYAPALSSAAGFEQLIGYPGEAPLGAMTVAFSDAMAAGQGVLLTLAGLLRRSRGGGGARIVLSQHEAAILANGRNIAAAQAGAPAVGLEPLPDDDRVVRGEALAGSPWVSPDLIGRVGTRWLSGVAVARLPWRRDGRLPALRGAGPELGADGAIGAHDHIHDERHPPA